jgi:hypothetical protein
MGVSASEVGYTSATARRKEHEVYKGKLVAVEKYIYIIIMNFKGWAIWPVPSPELQLLSPSFLWSPNRSLSLWAVVV